MYRNSVSAESSESLLTAKKPLPDIAASVLDVDCEIGPCWLTCCKRLAVTVPGEKRALPDSVVTREKKAASERLNPVVLMFAILLEIIAVFCDCALRADTPVNSDPNSPILVSLSLRVILVVVRLECQWCHRQLYLQGLPPVH